LKPAVITPSMIRAGALALGAVTRRNGAQALDHLRLLGLVVRILRPLKSSTSDGLAAAEEVLLGQCTS